ncbi:MULTISPECIES: hypothetical protein [Clostridia]|uniref:hypothetical protein n=1 Tax=Clostridia TaxID=186801 RepID=UPI001314D522|nr:MULTISPECIES: hypothetical protein [Clostridia]
MKVWFNNEYFIEEKPYNGNLHKFMIMQHDKHIETIIPADLNDQEQIIDYFDSDSKD